MKLNLNAFLGTDGNQLLLVTPKGTFRLLFNPRKLRSIDRILKKKRILKSINTCIDFNRFRFISHLTWLDENFFIEDR